MFQNVAYRPNVYKTGDAMQWGKVLFTFCTRVLYRSSHDHHRAFVCLPFIHFISLLNYLFYTSLPVCMILYTLFILVCIYAITYLYRAGLQKYKYVPLYCMTYF